MVDDKDEHIMLVRNSLLHCLFFLCVQRSTREADNSHGLKSIVHFFKHSKFQLLVNSPTFLVTHRHSISSSHHHVSEDDRVAVLPLVARYLRPSAPSLSLTVANTCSSTSSGVEATVGIVANARLRLGFTSLLLLLLALLVVLIFCFVRETCAWLLAVDVKEEWVVEEVARAGAGDEPNMPKVMMFNKEMEEDEED